MRPLILHNVPDEELYTGDDGIQRPYAMIWPEGDRQRPLPRTRVREITETGSFGKSTRRSRSRTGSQPPKREDATMQNADKIFSNYIASRQQASNAAAATTSGTTPSPPSQRKSSYLGQPVAPPAEEVTSTTQASTYRKEPTEIILRGYASPSQQYAAINHYEQLAGRICEDYSREPPMESRRYKSDLRDPALTRRKPLSPAERAKVNRIASGEHWVKITFESSEAADTALYASPQKILGYLVYAEPFRNLPPKEDAAVLDVAGDAGMLGPFRTKSFGAPSRQPSQTRAEKGAAFSNYSFPSNDRAERTEAQKESPTGSQTSTQTIDTATASTATVTGPAADAQQNKEQQDSAYCRRIPEARRVKLLPADQALAPQKTWQQRILMWIPLLAWFGGSMIGNEVPRNDVGEFDFNRASLYWKIMFYLDLWFGLFGRELVSGDKDD
ncbi:hypothetical protein GGS23DRAFT_548247 [Durotheca rogersii]|uniref:uncharacterized protein n=1 Tax=Durotheca rogersii TaxID=419775 RepID=UPI00221F9DF7|nr:uncharacterized protein GGS23DRAFT_548247 [Durotheca rogersii]KAI5867404.1 hypothetical protein GGS23DRAFT_548247 [Durotheca rogersii]